MTVKEAAEALETALETVPDIRVYRDLGGRVDPPSVVLGPPSVSWEALSTADPTSARFLVYVVVAADERAVERLWELLPLVAAVLDGVPNATVTRADPGTYSTGGSELPAYTIEVEVAL